MSRNIIFILAISALALTSCQQARERRQAARVNQDGAFCNSIGATGPAFTQCMLQRDSHNQANDRASVAAQQQAINNAINQPWVQRQTTTTCRQVGIQTVCQTY